GRRARGEGAWEATAPPDNQRERRGDECPASWRCVAPWPSPLALRPSPLDFPRSHAVSLPLHPPGPLLYFAIVVRRAGPHFVEGWSLRRHVRRTQSRAAS